MIINIIDLVSSILLISFLVPIYGILGYLIVIFVSEILNCILSMLVLINVSNINFNFKIWIFKPFVILIFSMSITIFLKIHSNAIFPLFVNVLIYGITFIFFSFVFKIVTKNELKEFL